VSVGVFVGGTGVGVSVGGTGVGMSVGVSVGGTGVSVGGTGEGVAVGTGVGVEPHATATRQRIITSARTVNCFLFILFPPSNLQHGFKDA
jgi:hypothetical protein